MPNSDSKVKNSGFFATKLAPPQRDAIQNKIRKGEGLRTSIYSDTSGVPTMGVGIALGYVENNTVVLYSKKEINQRVAMSGSNRRLLDSEYIMLQKAINPDLKEGQNLIDEVDGRLENLKFSITKPQAETQFENMFKEQMRNLESYADDAQVALQDLPSPILSVVADNSYRGGKSLVFGERSSEHLRKQNYGAFLTEIMYFSNKTGEDGIDNRNVGTVEEALAKATPSQREKWKQQAKGYHNSLPQEMQQDISNIDARFGQNSRIKNKDALGVGSEIKLAPQDREGAAEGGVQYAQNSSDAGGTEHVKAHMREGYPVKAYTRQA